MDSPSRSSHLLPKVDGSDNLKRIQDEDLLRVPDADSKRVGGEAADGAT